MSARQGRCQGCDESVERHDAADEKSQRHLATWFIVSNSDGLLGYGKSGGGKRWSLTVCFNVWAKAREWISHSCSHNEQPQKVCM
jgi:hypothetical protein